MSFPHNFPFKHFTIMSHRDIHFSWNCFWRRPTMGWTHGEAKPRNEYKLPLLGYSWSTLCLMVAVCSPKVHRERMPMRLWMHSWRHKCRLSSHLFSYPYIFPFRVHPRSTFQCFSPCVYKAIKKQKETQTKKSSHNILQQKGGEILVEGVFQFRKKEAAVFGFGEEESLTIMVLHRGWWMSTLREGRSVQDSFSKIYGSVWSVFVFVWERKRRGRVR